MSDVPHDPKRKPPTAEQRAYWEALGRFVHHFAGVETYITINLWKLTGVPIHIAQAAFSGVRMDAAMSLIHRLLDATNADQEIRDEFQYIFTQLGHIAKVRNDLLHYGITSISRNPGPHTSNILAAYRKEKIRETFVSPEILNRMADDLITIQRLLGRIHERGWIPAEIQEEMHGPYSRGTWRYRPPPQASHPRTPQARRPKRKHPPRSSPP